MGGRDPQDGPGRILGGGRGTDLGGRTIMGQNDQEIWLAGCRGRGGGGLEAKSMQLSKQREAKR